MGDAAFDRLLKGMRRHDEAAFERFIALAQEVASRALCRYVSEAYRLGPTPEDRGQQFAEHLACMRLQRGDDYLVDIVARCTAMDHLRRFLAKKAREWAINRSRTSLGYKLIRRIRHLPAVDPLRFLWVVANRLLGLVGGSPIHRTMDRFELAARVVGSSAGLRAIADYREREFIGKDALREVVEAMLSLLDGAARPEPLADVVLLICGQADTTPPIARRAPLPADEPRLPLDMEIVCVHRHLRFGKTGTEGELARRLGRSLAGANDKALERALAAALVNCDVDREDHPKVLTAVYRLLSAADEGS